jgi:tRNA-splicing ligase RtcB
MIFAQTYAEQSRHAMCQAVADALGATVEEKLNSTHNYIDWDDLTIRKGATRAHDGERQVIPFNMRDGAVIVRGLGNERWNRSAPHGAGRRGSRTWAYEEFDLAEFATEMDGVFSTSVTEETLDEAPMAYKDHETILDAISGRTVEIEETLTPKLNIKAEQ